MTCSRCLRPGHLVTQRQNVVTCRVCYQSGHKSGDPACQVFTDTYPKAGSSGDILNRTYVRDEAMDTKDPSPSPSTESQKPQDADEDLQDEEEDVWEEPQEELEPSAQSLPPRQRSYSHRRLQASVTTASTQSSAEGAAHADCQQDGPPAAVVENARERRDDRLRLFESDSDHDRSF